ncbi:HD domain-containing phosphohydrolase [Chloroflexota bacterium]
MTGEKEGILIVSGDEELMGLLYQMLSGQGYQCMQAVDAGRALEVLRDNEIALVILDVGVPGKSGIELLAEIKDSYPGTALVIAAAAVDASIAIQCINQGAYDYIIEPFNFDEVAISIDRAMERRRLELENREYRQHMEDMVAEQSGRIRASFLNAVRALAFALEAKDKYTSGHSQRVADISAAIAKELGLPDDSIDKIVLAGLVHDIGKIGVMESILNKPSGLTGEEVKHIHKHPETGEHILGPIAGDEEIMKYIRYHHSRFDGTGYPGKLKGYQIPLGARILAVADAYEAMTSERPYRGAMSDKAACIELERCKDSQFDPEVVNAFFRSKRSKS